MAPAWLCKIVTLNTAPALTCRRCSAKLTYVPGQNASLQCRFCGEVQPLGVERAGAGITVSSYEELLAGAAAHCAEAEVATLLCNTCGATTTKESNVISARCPFCESPVIAAPQARLRAPDGVLPFSLNELQARAELEAWERALWFKGQRLFGGPAAPPVALHPIYLPYWSFDWDVTTSYVGATGNKQRVERRGAVRNVFTQSTVLASRTVPLALGADLEPWDLENVVAPRPELFAGIRAETFAEGDGLARGALLSHRLLEREADHAIFKEVGQISIESRHVVYHAVALRLLLLPAWVMSYRLNGKTFRVLVNGRNGETVGERPFHRPRIAAALMAPLVLPLGIAASWAFTRTEQRYAAFVLAFWGVLFAQAVALVFATAIKPSPRQRRQGQFFMHREGEHHADNFAELWAAAMVQRDAWARRRVFIQAGVICAFFCIGPLLMTGFGRANDEIPSAVLVVFAHLWVALGLFGFWYAWRVASKEKRYLLGLSDEKP